MRVALVSNFPVYSGTGKVPYQLWQTFNREGLVKADYFLTHFLKSSDHRLKEYQGVKVLHPFDYLRSPFLSRLMIYFLDPFLLPRGYDLYHFGNHMIARFAKFRRPSVVSVHDVLQFKYSESFKNPVVTALYNHFMKESIKCLTKASHLLCVSQWSAGELLKQFPEIDPGKVSVVYNGIDHKIFKPHDKIESRQKLGLPLDKKIILHIGSEIPRKQIPLLLKSFRELKFLEPQFLLLRHGEKTGSSTSLIASLGLVNDVWYRDQTEEDLLPYYYGAADLMLVTSAEEGFCLPVIEAMACGLPVVTTIFTSLKEVAGEAQAATINDLKEESVVRAVRTVFDKVEPAIEEIRQKGFANAGRFGWEKNAQETYEIYQKVIGRYPRVGDETAAVSSG